MTVSSGYIEISNLEVFSIIGVFPEERDQPQRLFVDVRLTFDPVKAVESDALSHTTDYADVVRAIKELCSGSSYQLVESLAGSIADDLLSRFTLSEEVTVSITKVNTPALLNEVMDPAKITIRVSNQRSNNR